MTEADNFNSQHRPLVGGVAIMPSAGERQRGTLTAVARRANGAKVLVINLPVPHISSPPTRTSP